MLQTLLIRLSNENSVDYLGDSQHILTLPMASKFRTLQLLWSISFLVLKATTNVWGRGGQVTPPQSSLFWRAPGIGLNQFSLGHCNALVSFRSPEKVDFDSFCPCSACFCGGVALPGSLLCHSGRSFPAWWLFFNQINQLVYQNNLINYFRSPNLTYAVSPSMALGVRLHVYGDRSYGENCSIVMESGCWIKPCRGRGSLQEPQLWEVLRQNFLGTDHKSMTKFSNVLKKCTFQDDLVSSAQTLKSEINKFLPKATQFS